MSKALATIEGFVAIDPVIRDAGSYRVTEVIVPHTPSKLVDGTWVQEEDKTVWTSSTFWNEHADSVVAAVRKGSLVTVSGVMGQDVFLRKDGTPGGKVTITNPTISVVVRKPAKGQMSTPANDEPWGSSSQSDPWAVTSTPGTTFRDDPELI
jgi:single-stranded DNA-binding protein